MVSRQNKFDHGIGGHIATYASIATLFEVGFNHFFHASYGKEPGDCVYFQGHASPGVYARAFLEGRLTAERLANFRHELRDHPGLSSYPHPWLMPDFWKFPTVSMGIAPINAIYQARFMRYLENRGLIAKTPRKVWAFLGDGEMDEPESMGSLTLASREKLDNLVFVINCNLQRLDGPVRGNGKIIQELEAAFLEAAECHQGDLGNRLGRVTGARQIRPADQAHGRVRGWRVPVIQSQGRCVHPQRIFGSIRKLEAGRALERRAGR
jgi:pyruvate dehydrogenase E1 component